MLCVSEFSNLCIDFNERLKKVYVYPRIIKSSKFK